jgi:hypothetical protein
LEAHAVVASLAFSVVVPVRDEEAVLPKSVPALLDASGDQAKIVWVCNGCSDRSAEIIRTLSARSSSNHTTVLELPLPGKAAALQAGDDFLAQLFPRFYIDADVLISAADFAVLSTYLSEDWADLVSPGHAFDTQGISLLSSAVAACWLELPHARETAFSKVLGLSATGRGRWERWPDVTGDDIFVAAKIPAARRRMLGRAVAITRPPADFWGWVRMRARWCRGERELVALRLEAPRANGQRACLLRLLLSRSYAVGAWALLISRLLAQVLSVWPAPRAWRPDRRT